MYFEKILGQEVAKKFIINSINKNRLSHAYIFQGPKGVGKKEFALEFSKVILKDNLVASPDFKIIEPSGSTLKIEQIRDLQSDIYIKPYKDKKIYILNGSDKMSIQAQNSLLKTLEEPPAYMILILIVENSSLILDTIKSRCEIIKFHPVKNDLIEDYLINILGLGKEKAKVFSAFSNGILKKSIELIEDEDFSKRRDDIDKFLRLVLSKDAIGCISAIAYLETEKDYMDEVFDIMSTYLRDILFEKEGVGEGLIINLDKIEYIKAMSKKLTYSQALNIIDIIEDARKKINSNCNFTLCIQVMVINIQEVIK